MRHNSHILGYPESFPSVKDLHECLARTQLKPVLAQSLKATLEARLLHQGATTEDILIAYVSAIRASASWIQAESYWMRLAIRSSSTSAGGQIQFVIFYTVSQTAVVIWEGNWS